MDVTGWSWTTYCETPEWVLDRFYQKLIKDAEDRKNNS